MPLEGIDARVICDGCGKKFFVELDMTDNPGSSPEDWVRETIRGGQSPGYVWGVRGKHTLDRFQLDYNVTVQGGLMLCDECSKKCDDAPIEGNLSVDEVKAVLGLITDEDFIEAELLDEDEDDNE